jgi:hypothetical protein
MPFLIDSLTSDPQTFRNQLDRYYDYLKSIEDALPPSALSFARAPWHYDFSKHESPHDSWLESCTIYEPASGERHQNREIAITLSLLGAYHDGHIKLVYTNVTSYEMTTGANGEARAKRGHGDWLIDEIHLSDRGLVLHEILFSSGARWLIESEDIEYSWEPAEGPG